jgi:acetyl-CoA carboxylase biotin carboxyl carrier protein
MNNDTLVASVNGSGQASLDQRLRTLRAEAARLVDEVAGPLKHVSLRTGDCSLELTWADPPPVVVAAPDPAAPDPAAPVAPATATASGEAETFAVVAPLVGVFYAAPSPGAQPFVRPGDRVGANQVVGIIEAMKLMNHIATEAAGIVTEVLVADGEPVEFGQELVRVQPDPDPADD